MRVLARLLAAGIGWALVAPGISASAAGASFLGTITPTCVVAGNQLTIALTNAGEGPGNINVAAVQIAYPDSNSHGVQTIVGIVDSQGNFTATFTIPPTAIAGAGVLKVEDVGTLLSGTSYPAGFSVVTDPAACPTPAPTPTPVVGANNLNQSRTAVRKTCDTGVTGSAAFDISLTLSDFGVINFPAGARLTAPCNGSTQLLPAVPDTTVTITLHEAVLPAGAVAAADTTFSANNLGPILINNRAAVVATPSPTPSLTPSPTPSPTHSPTPNPTHNPTPTATTTPTPSTTPSPTPSPTSGPLPSPTPNATSTAGVLPQTGGSGTGPSGAWPALALVIVLAVGATFAIVRRLRGLAGPAGGRP